MARYHRSLESPATAICHDAMSKTGEKIPREYDTMYGWCGPARYAASVGLKTPVSFASETVQNWCLVSSGQARSVRNTEHILAM